MEIILNILKKNNYKHFVLGIYKNGVFYERPSHFKLNAIKVKIKQNFEKRFLNMLVPLTLNEIVKNKYETVYRLNNNIFLFVEYVVDSHIIVPKVFLKDFKSADTRLYYIDTTKDKIEDGSVKKFNTEFGYFSPRFEEYLSNNFENKIGDIKTKLEDFVFNKRDEVQFVDLFNDIKKILNMSFFRNPRFIEEINKSSLSSKLIYKGYNSEDVASFYNEFGTNILEGMSICILANRTDEGFVLSGEIFSNITIKEKIHGLILPLHSKYGILVIPTEYYQQQNKNYAIIDDVEILRKINKRIYNDCKLLGINVIGRKEDLKKILMIKK